MYIIYKLFAKSDTEKIPKYIGITASSLNLRLKRHVHKVKYHNDNWPIINWIRNLLDNGDEVLIEPIDFANTQEEAFQKEIYYIEKFNKEGFKLKNATSGGDGHKGVKINQFNKDGTLIKTWPFIVCIEKELGLSNSHITSCCKGKYGRKTVGGFIWRYENDSFDKYLLPQPRNYSKISIRKPILQIDFNGNIVKRWEHGQQIEDELGFFRTNINTVCRLITTSHKQREKTLRKSNGFYWCYESDKDIVRSLLKSKNAEQVDNW